jgi:hypothetical protein
MRLLILFIFIVLTSCSNSSRDKVISTGMKESDKPNKSNAYGASTLMDTPRIWKAGKDYITISTSPNDKVYFGDHFAPYKIEPYEIADLERVIDSLIKSQNAKGVFKNKSLTDFKYQIYSVKTSVQKLEARVQAICSEIAERRNWSSSRIEIADGGKCYFSMIYDLTEKKVLRFEIDSEG